MSHIEGSGSQWPDSPAVSGSKTLVHSTAVSIENIRIASPCTASWDRMEGNERVRFCGSCQKSVYNLSAMSRTEAENLVAEKEGRVCVRYSQRADGKVLTSDCPVGLRGVRRKIALRLSMTIALAFSLWSFILGRGWIPAHEMGGIGRRNATWRQDQSEPVCRVLNNIDRAPMMESPLSPPMVAPPPPPLMGAIAIAPRMGKYPSHHFRVARPPSTSKTPPHSHGETAKSQKTDPKSSHLHQIKME